MKLKKVKLSDLVEAPFNYNRHPESQISELAKSLDRFDQFKNIVVWQGQVIAGNGLVMAARHAGWKSIHVLVKDDLTEEQARSLCAADNALPMLSEPDGDALKALLEGIDEPFDVPGVDDAWLESMDVVLDEDLTLDDAPGEGSGDDEGGNVITCPKCGFSYEEK